MPARCCFLALAFLLAFLVQATAAQDLTARHQEIANVAAVSHNDELTALFDVSYAKTVSPIGVFAGQEDIGNSKAGKGLFDPALNAYMITGGGADTSAKSDTLHFVYTKMSGDITFSADVQFEGKGPNLRRRAVLMFRQSLQPDSAFADVALHGDGLTSLEYRPTAGVAASEFRAAMKAPSQLSIIRHGHEFTIYAGRPGEESAMTGPIVVAMQDPVFLGLGVSSHNADALETAVFSRVRVTKGKGK